MTDQKQCDHVLGIIDGTYGGSHVLHLQSEQSVTNSFVPVDDLFEYCPRCGQRNTGPGFEDVHVSPPAIRSAIASAVAEERNKTA